MPRRLPTIGTQPKQPRQRDHRATAAKRGYGGRWQRFRAWFLKRHPLCVRCQRPAVHVDHIVPVTGPNDPNFYKPGNHQALCHACHNRKTSEDVKAAPTGRAKRKE